MLKLIVFVSCVLIPLSSAIVQEYGQCGGKSYTGDKQCAAGLTCQPQNEWYSQCVKGSSNQQQQPSQQTTTTTTTKASSQSTQQQQQQQNGGSSSGGCPASFPNGQFRNGIAFDQINNVDMNNYDYISIWMNTIDNERKTTDFNVWYQGDMLKKCIEKNKIPLFYAYVIAFEARFKKHLEDCDVNYNYNLCTGGAQFIRENRAHLVSRYSHHAENIAKIYGTSKPVIFVMEPDFWQYFGDSRQGASKMKGEEMAQLFNDFVDAIKKHLPNAIISWDISAWLSESAMREWWGYFNKPGIVEKINFINTSGGQTRGDLPNLKPNELSWKFMSTLTGRKIIADCGYGVAGGLDTNCDKWANDSNQQSRVADGVIALTSAKENGRVEKVKVNC